MIVIVCVDDNMGMIFNKRRQSRDRTVIDKIYEIIGEDRLFVNEYSSGLFSSDRVTVDEAMLDKAENEDFCFVENLSLKNHVERIDKLILFKWNRNYPSDFKLDIPLDKFREIFVEDFKGNSHDNITKVVYSK